MLTRTFCHVPGIGYETERALWEQGCHDWDCYLRETEKTYSVGSACPKVAREWVERSRQALHHGEYQFFTTALGLRDSWRAWPTLRDQCVYLDIETDGGNSGSSITMVGVYDGHEYRCFVKDDNLENFRDAISNFAMIVTFFGSGFDVPMLRKRFGEQIIDQVHLDLCPSLRQVGYRGGLKSIERQLGLSRSEATEGLNGRDAITLWRRFRMGDDDALETLRAYNREDVVNLEALAQVAFDRLESQLLARPASVKATLRR